MVFADEAVPGGAPRPRTAAEDLLEEEAFEDFSAACSLSDAVLLLLVLLVSSTSSPREPPESEEEDFGSAPEPAGAPSSEEGTPD